MPDCLSMRKPCAPSNSTLRPVLANCETDMTGVPLGRIARAYSVRMRGVFWADWRQGGEARGDSERDRKTETDRETTILRQRPRRREREMQRQRRRDGNADIVPDKTQLRAYVSLPIQFLHSRSLCFALARLSAHVGRVSCMRCSASFAQSLVMEGPPCAVAHTMGTTAVRNA